MQSLRTLAVGHLSHRWCANESVRCVGGVEYCVPQNSAKCCALCFSMHSILLFPFFTFWITDTRLAPPDFSQAQNAHATVYLAVVEALCFSATFLQNGSDERQRSGRMKAVGCWFESGWCVGALQDSVAMDAPSRQWSKRRRCDRRRKCGCRTGLRAKLKANPQRTLLPSILLSNICSLENKLDYLKLDFTLKQDVRDCCAIILTETR